MRRREESSQPAGRAEERHREFEPGGKVRLRAEEFLARRALAREPGEISFERDSEPLYQRGARQKEALLAKAAPAAVAWAPLGPAGIPGGQTYGSGPGGVTTVAGRIAAIAVDPSDSGHLLVGSAAGGVWESRDTGATWAPRTDGQPTLSIGALAFDPADPSKVYAGTGEGNYPAYAQLGQGILRSDDGGSSWAVVGGSRVFAGYGFYRLLVDPRDSARLLAATTAAAAFSPDGGESWGAFYLGAAWDLSLAYMGDEPEILLATPDGLLAVKGTAAPAELALPGIWAGEIERMAVAHVPSDPGQAFVFAASPERAFLWHRAAADAPLVEIPLPHFAVGENVQDLFGVGQAFYDWYAALPPGHSDVLYLGAFELVKGERAAGGSWEWSDISSRSVEGDSIHPDQHTMAFDPQDSNVIYAGNDGGVFRSPDGGATWKSLNAGLAISEVEYLAQRPDEPTWILAGLQDNGTVRREGGGEWAQVGLGDGGDCGIDMSSPDVCFHSYYYMSLQRSVARGDPDSWENVTPSVPSRFKKLFYPPVEVNGQVVVKAGEVVCLSSNAGDTWAKARLSPTAAGEPSIASAVAIPDPTRVVVGTIWGDVFRIDAAAAGGAAQTSSPSRETAGSATCSSTPTFPTATGSPSRDRARSSAPTTRASPGSTLPPTCPRCRSTRSSPTPPIAIASGSPATPACSSRPTRVEAGPCTGPGSPTPSPWTSSSTSRNGCSESEPAAAGSGRRPPAEPGCWTL